MEENEEQTQIIVDNGKTIPAAAKIAETLDPLSGIERGLAVAQFAFYSFGPGAREFLELVAELVPQVAAWDEELRKRKESENVQKP